MTVGVFFGDDSRVVFVNDKLFLIPDKGFRG